MFIDIVLEADIEDHLGYLKHEEANKHNWHTKQTVRSDSGELETYIPRDGDSSSDPLLVSKHQNLAALS